MSRACLAMEKAMKFILGIVVGATLVGLFARAENAPSPVIISCGEPGAKCDHLPVVLMNVSCERLSLDALEQIRQVLRR